MGSGQPALVPGLALSQYSKLIAMPNLSSKTMMGSCLQISLVPGATEDKQHLFLLSVEPGDSLSTGPDSDHSLSSPFHS